MGRKRVKYQRRQFVLNSAETAMGQLQIRPREFEEGSAVSIAEQLVKKYGQAVRDHLKLRHSPATLGKLADCGIGKDSDPMAEADRFRNFSGTGTSMVQAMGGGWLNERQYGCNILLDVATAALLAAMADTIFISHCQEDQRREERVQERMRNYNDK